MQELNKVVQILRQSRRILCITGAGISADSGMPTYRGIGGLYDREGTEEGMPIEVAMSGKMLCSRPEITWKYLSQIEAACRNAEPNAGHQAIAGLQQRFEVCVLTQNVDGLHRRAGSRNLIEMHGSYEQLYCLGCDWQEQVQDYTQLALPPYCETCGAMIRPRVVLFGEMLPQAALDHYYRELAQGFEAVLSIGTTSVFPYIAGPVIEASRSGVPTVEINPGDSEVSHLVDVRIRERSAVVLPAIAQALNIAET